MVGPRAGSWHLAAARRPIAEQVVGRAVLLNHDNDVFERSGWDRLSGGDTCHRYKSKYCQEGPWENFHVNLLFLSPPGQGSGWLNGCRIGSGRKRQGPKLEHAKYQIRGRFQKRSEVVTESGQDPRRFGWWQR